MRAARLWRRPILLPNMLDAGSSLPGPATTLWGRKDGDPLSYGFSGAILLRKILVASFLFARRDQLRRTGDAFSPGVSGGPQARRNTRAGLKCY